ncbi:MAG TPA: glycine cleavage system aminomethyltransferase GcvT [Candidatus Bathyarchaeota archaeon]|nr:MAG: glycine cleavage system aminomethyltransferase GcvT [Candidatus Bathyarchaeota archaeon]HDI07542.1 glycine cleavage system aminomethyltransferase GcvT [Candidatus Bathyarchaeota archaeon]
MQQAKRTHLYQFHRENAEITVFAGFEMPLWFKGIIPEHLAVRNSVGIFDITHMGRAIITGPDAEQFLNYVTTNNVQALAPLSAHYSLMCNEKGGIKDDFVLSRLERDKFLMVYNAANREKDYQWLKKNAEKFDVNIQDVSDNIAMFAVQGPKAQETLQKISSGDLSQIKRFKCGWTELSGTKVFISRTGYTGEDGFEIFVWDTPLSNPDKAVKVWNTILEAGKEFGIQPCGLGARDTLRLEAGLCLYGNDIDEETTPLEARLSFVVKFDKGEFIGKQALLKQREEGIKKRRVGIVMIDRGIPRAKFEIYREEQKIGYVTSGTFSPLLRKGIAMGYVQKEHAKEETEITIKIRRKNAKAKIVKFPLYDAEKYGYRRKT